MRRPRYDAFGRDLGAGFLHRLWLGLFQACPQGQSAEDHCDEQASTHHLFRFLGEEWGSDAGDHDDFSGNTEHSGLEHERDSWVQKRTTYTLRKECAVASCGKWWMLSQNYHKKLILSNICSTFLFYNGRIAPQKTLKTKSISCQPLGSFSLLYSFYSQGFLGLKFAWARSVISTIKAWKRLCSGWP